MDFAQQHLQADDERRPLLDGGRAQQATDADSAAEPIKTTWASRNQWIVLAMASGACAAFNGAFAKL